MKTKVTFEIKKPDGVSDKDFQDWLNYEMGIAPMRSKNQMLYSDLRSHAKNVQIEIITHE